MASEIGSSAAPPMPCPARKTMSQSIVGAKPQSSENSVNSARPKNTNTRFWPYLSEMRPLERNSTASARL